MVKVAIVQFTGDMETEKNVEKILRYSVEAADNGAQVICHQELANSAYFCFEEEHKYFPLAEPIPGPTTERVATLAQQKDVTIILPLYEKVIEGELYNSAAVIGPDGRIVGTYRKLSIPLMKNEDCVSNEKFYFRPGNNGLPVFDLSCGLRIGIVICYDRHFPEALRVLALKGADVIFAPSATSTLEEVWEIELRAHAFANLLYVGGINRVGQDVGGTPLRDHFGSSIFVDPSGAIIEQASDRKDQVIYAEIDRQYIADIRNKIGFYRDRRPDVYGFLCQ